MRAWMVRAGASGQREQQALDEGRLLPGWTNVDANLAGVGSRQEIRSLLRSVHGESVSARTLGSWAGQLWRFVHTMSEGDLVVMPMKNTWGAVAIGRITGPYAFDADAAAGCQHYRPVEWASRLVQKESLGPDLRASLGALSTICELSRNDAALRIEHAWQHGEDPDAPSYDESTADEYLAQVAQRVESGESPSTTVRDLLSRWGFFRRTANSVAAVMEALSEYGLLAVPPITDGGIDDVVLFFADPDEESSTSENPSPDVSEAELNTAQLVTQDVASGEIRYAVGSLPSASCDVASVQAGTPLAQALTSMALASYSQLAVVDEENRLVGAITWESIAMSWASGTPEAVRDAMVEAQSVATSEELLSLTPRISEHGYVFVRDSDGRVQGIVTSADLTRKFGDDQAPIIQLDEIERRLGSHVREHCTDADLLANDVRVPNTGKTLGTYVTALNRPVLWEKLGWHGVDQDMLHALMDKVRVIRNDVMHFSPDPITPRELATLSSAMRTLRLITSNPEQG